MKVNGPDGFYSKLSSIGCTRTAKGLRERIEKIIDALRPRTPDELKDGKYYLVLFDGFEDINTYRYYEREKLFFDRFGNATPLSVAKTIWEKSALLGVE